MHRHTNHTLWHFRLCPHSRAVRMALDEFGIAVELVDVQPWAWGPELLALNPAGELPILRIAHGALLCGVWSIAEYLAEAPRGERMGHRTIQLFPGNREDRAEVRRLADWFLGKFHREVTRELMLEKVIPLLSGAPSTPDAEVLRAIRAGVRYHLGYIAFLAYQRRWLAGDEPSFADIAAAAQLSCLDHLGEVPWDEHPPARDWYSRMKSRPAMRALLADKVPGVAAPLHYGNPDF